MATLPFENDSLKFSLQAINILLQSINESPITDDTEIVDLLEAQIAASVLEETKKKVLSSGWDINSDVDWAFQPDIDGNIAIQANILDISDAQGRYYMRDWKLYDKKEQSFNFTDVVKCDVIWDLDFNALTHPIRYYITLRASRTFQYRMIGDEKQYQFSVADVDDAYLDARRSQHFTGKHSLKNGSYGINFRRTN